MSLDTSAISCRAVAVVFSRSVLIGIVFLGSRILVYLDSVTYSKNLRHALRSAMAIGPLEPDAWNND